MQTLDSTKTNRIRPWLWCVAFAFLLPAGAQADDFTDVSKLLNGRQYKEALVKIDLYLTTKPRDPQMRFMRGIALSESGRVSEAIPVFSKITEDFPDLPEPHNNLAVLYAGQNQLDKARMSLESAIRVNPSYATAQENLGDVYARLASQAYSKALQLDASNKALQPKLALVRSLFNPDTKGQRASLPLAAASGATQQTPNAVPATAAVAATPASASVTAPAVVAASGAQGAAAASASATPKAAAPTATQAEVEAAVRRWATAWGQKDMDVYLGAYGKDFAVPGKQTRQGWEEQRRARISGKGSISVQLSDMSVTATEGKATAKFRQSYKAGTLVQNSRKTLNLVFSDGRWVIVREADNS